MGQQEPHLDLRVQDRVEDEAEVATEVAARLYLTIGRLVRVIRRSGAREVAVTARGERGAPTSALGAILRGRVAALSPADRSRLLEAMPVLEALGRDEV